MDTMQKRPQTGLERSIIEALQRVVGDYECLLRNEGKIHDREDDDFRQSINAAIAVIERRG